MKNKSLKILVTGGAGFIASNIVDAYLQAGHQVVVMDNFFSGKRENLNPRARFYQVDIRDEKKVNEVFSRERPQVINHHAAQIDVRKSGQNPALDAGINILGTINLLKAAVAVGVKKFIFASSGGVMYGECSRENPPTEQVLAAPISPYGLSKLCGEKYIYYFAANYPINFLIFRYGNVYGPRQDPHGEAGVVAIFVGQMLKNKPVRIYGNGKQLRDYVYVGDVVRANLLALSRGKNEVVNIGSGQPHSVRDIFFELSRIIGYRRKPRFYPPRPGELFCSTLNINQARRVLNFQPETTLAAGLRQTVKYFRKEKK